MSEAALKKEIKELKKLLRDYASYKSILVNLALLEQDYSLSIYDIGGSALVEKQLKRELAEIKKKCKKD